MSLPCLILCGGLGTRLGDRTQSIPKALIPIAGKPFIDWQLEWLASQGVERVVLSIGYRGELIRSFVGGGQPWGLTVEYADEGSQLRGTGGAVRFAIDEGMLTDDFFLLYGDSYLTVDFAHIASQWKKIDASALMTVFHNEGRWDSSNVVFDSGRIILYDKKQKIAAMQWIDYGLSIIRPDSVRSCIPAGSGHDIADFFHSLSVDGQLAGTEVTSRFYEVGSVQGIADFKEYLELGGRIIAR